MKDYIKCMINKSRNLIDSVIKRLKARIIINLSLSTLKMRLLWIDFIIHKEKKLVIENKIKPKVKIKNIH